MTKDYFGFPEKIKKVQIRDFMETLDPNFAWDASVVAITLLMQLNRKGFSKLFYDEEKEKLLTPTR